MFPRIRNVVSRAAAYGLAAVGGGIYTDYKYNSVETIASEFVSASLAFKHLQREKKKDGPECTSGERDLDQVVYQAAENLSTRATWTLLKYVVFAGHDSDEVYRLEWIIAQLQSINAILVPQKAFEFERQCDLYYGSQVSPEYLDEDRTTQLLQELDELLPRSASPLHERYRAYRNRFVIPKKQYQPVFRKLVDDMIHEMKQHVPELHSAHLTQKYVDDSSLCFEATCQATSRKESEMLVNIARSITYDKAQQLAVHELTHHLQFVLMEHHLYPRFPEMRASIDAGPLDMLLEGGAELVVDLLLPPAERLKDLETRVPRGRFSTGALRDALKVERITWSGLWPCSIRIARDFINGELSKQEAMKAMQEQALKSNDSWPNVAFFEEYGAYVQSYGWGKELILEYLQVLQSQKHPEGNSLEDKRKQILEEYIEFMKRPPTPSRMQDVINQAR
ncbi:hypothetical protein CYMTET_9892 [Cymbomonas tetramitiformis]|uniref:Uncharacterized protein n=1 Tax=Cymbomonas tetramitiformis TaxID=36881 RepID=A0AAE0LED7_9CHLO|nr:hypothetical protein CYMTET_9892 [Cymbomonas tetramitiformis]